MAMRKDKNLFIGLCIAMVASFLLCGYSLIRCFVIGFDNEDVASSLFEISYLFIHLIIVAIIFYLSFRAIKQKSFFISNLMVGPNQEKYVKKQIVFGVLAFLFLSITVYATLNVFGLKLPLHDFMGHIIWHDLMNGGLLFTIIFTSFAIYPFYI